VQQHGLKVILTTHSPSTVALAPADSLFVMRRHGEPRLVHATRDEALSALTVGISVLTVSVEDRRQVFVESEYDQAVYQELYRIVRPRLSEVVSLEFIASGRGGAGGCDAVKHLVSSLRGAGNDKVLGLIDRDDRGGAGEGILFNSSRYSIENYILDPLCLGAFLLREQLVSSEELGLSAGVRHFELSEDHARPLRDAVVEHVVAHEALSEQTVAYEGGFSLPASDHWLECKGHDLEAQIKVAYPGLLRWRREGELMVEVVRRAYADVPNYIPVEILDTLRDLQADS